MWGLGCSEASISHLATLKSLRGGASGESGFCRKPRKDPSSLRTKYRVRQFLKCSPAIDQSLSKNQKVNPKLNCVSTSFQQDALLDRSQGGGRGAWLRVLSHSSGIVEPSKSHPTTSSERARRPGWRRRRTLSTTMELLGSRELFQCNGAMQPAGTASLASFRRN